MAEQPERSGRLLAGTATALLLGLVCSSVFASNDHGLTDSAADMNDPASDPTAEKLTSRTLAEVADAGLNDSSESSSANEEDADSANDLPETALRLPGVSEEEQPRFRRRMYRTDI